MDKELLHNLRWYTEEFRGKIKQLMKSYGASFWLKDATRELMKRDPIDALADAQALVRIMEARVQDIH